MTALALAPRDAARVDRAPRPLIYLASAVPPGWRTAIASTRRLHAAASEFGYDTHLALSGPELPLRPEDDAALDRAALVVCNIPSEDWEIPVEIVVAALRSVPAVALIARSTILGSAASEVLNYASQVRYDRDPLAALHTHLRTLNHAPELTR